MNRCTSRRHFCPKLFIMCANFAWGNLSNEVCDEIKYCFHHYHYFKLSLDVCVDWFLLQSRSPKTSIMYNFTLLLHILSYFIWPTRNWFNALFVSEETDVITFIIIWSLLTSNLNCTSSLLWQIVWGKFLSY